MPKNPFWAGPSAKQPTNQNYKEKHKETFLLKIKEKKSKKHTTERKEATNKHKNKQNQVIWVKFSSKKIFTSKFMNSEKTSRKELEGINAREIGAGEQNGVDLGQNCLENPKKVEIFSEELEGVAAHGNSAEGYLEQPGRQISRFRLSSGSSYSRKSAKEIHQKSNLKRIKSSQRPSKEPQEDQQGSQKGSKPSRNIQKGSKRRNLGCIEKSVLSRLEDPNSSIGSSSLRLEPLQMQTEEFMDELEDDINFEFQTKIQKINQKKSPKKSSGAKKQERRLPGGCLPFICTQESPFSTQTPKSSKSAARKMTLNSGQKGIKTRHALRRYATTRGSDASNSIKSHQNAVSPEEIRILFSQDLTGNSPQDASRKPYRHGIYHYEEHVGLSLPEIQSKKFNDLRPPSGSRDPKEVISGETELSRDKSGSKSIKNCSKISKSEKSENRQIDQNMGLKEQKSTLKSINGASCSRQSCQNGRNRQQRQRHLKLSEQPKYPKELQLKLKKMQEEINAKLLEECCSLEDEMETDSISESKKPAFGAVGLQRRGVRIRRPVKTFHFGMELTNQPGGASQAQKVNRRYNSTKEIRIKRRAILSRK